MGGKIESIDQDWWKEFAAASGWEVSFAMSTWSELPLRVNPWIEARTVWRDIESQVEVALAYRELAKGITSHPPEVRPLNTLMMWHKWMRLSQSKAMNNCDLVIKTRADVALDRGDMKSLIRVCQSTSRSGRAWVAIPSGGDFRQGINDILVVGKVDAVRHYLRLLDSVWRYYESLAEFHPEKMLRFHLIDSGGFRVRRFPCRIVLRGLYFNSDRYKSYTDALPLRAGKGRTAYEQMKREGAHVTVREMAKQIIRRLFGWVQGGG
jgi:hypothetical protein